MGTETGGDPMDHAGWPPVEAAPGAREERLRLALTAAGAATWDWDLETGEIARSEGMAALFDWPAGALEGALDEHFVRIHPDDRGLIAEMDRRHLAEGVPYDVEYRVVRPDGGVRWLREKARAVRDADGRAVRLVGVTMDVTDRKAAESALREAEGTYRTLVEHIPAVTYAQNVDETGTLLYISPQVETVMGYSPAELVSGNTFWTQFLHPDDRERVLAEDARTDTTGEPFRCEYRMRARDGRYVWFYDTAALVRVEPGVPPFWQGVMLDVTRQKEAESALREAEARYRTLVEQIPAITYALALNAEAATPSVLYVSPQSETILGYPPEEWQATPGLWMQILHPDDRERVLAVIASAEAAKAPIRNEYRLIARDGRAIWVRDESALVRDSAGRPRYRHGVILDVTERREAEEAVRRSEGALAEAQRVAHLGSWELDLATGEGRWSAESYRIFGVAPGEGRLTQQRYMELVHPDDRRRLEAVVGEALARGGGAETEYRIVRPDGSQRTLHLRAEAIRDGAGRPVRLLGTNQDVTGRKELEERLRYLAYHDPLTGLPNRTLFMERLDEALGRVRRGADPVAVLLLDLDGFKLVNDSRGHEAGDRLLAEVGRRLREALRPGDTLARLGGDEFAVLLERIADAREAVQAAERLIRALLAPIVLDWGETHMQASVGIVVSARRRSRPVDLLRSADIALYWAKAAGRGTFAVFGPRMQAPVTERLARETALRRALERDELRLHYQPKVELATGRIVGAEALVRWARPEHGLRPPGDFIPAAEETGLIVPLGRWVLREACRQAAEWKELHPAAPLTVCVNVSVRQLQEAGFAAEVARALKEGGLDPGCLELELTESVAMGDAPETRRALRALRKLGVRLAIDDFGTGYSSLGRLRDLAVDALKVDGSFVAGLGKDGASLAIVRAVAVLAHDLGLAVIAEGVETAAQAARLRELGVELGQGFRFAPPLPAEAFGDLMARGACLPEDADVPDGSAHAARDMSGAQDAEHASGVGRGAEAKLAVSAAR